MEGPQRKPKPTETPQYRTTSIDVRYLTAVDRLGPAVSAAEDLPYAVNLYGLPQNPSDRTTVRDDVITPVRTCSSSRRSNLCHTRTARHRKSFQHCSRNSVCQPPKAGLLPRPSEGQAARVARGSCRNTGGKVSMTRTAMDGFTRQSPPRILLVRGYPRSRLGCRSALPRSRGGNSLLRSWTTESFVGRTRR